MASFRRLTVWGFALVAIILLFVLFPSAASPKPYSRMSNYASVEGFEEEEKEEEEKEEEKEDEGFENDKTMNGAFSLGSMFGMPSGNASVKSEGFEPIADSAKTLQSGMIRDSEIIDKFSQVTSNGIEGQNGCVSSGLTNSGGYICLTPDLIKLMTTRGGNATGQDSQIGAPDSK